MKYRSLCTIASELHSCIADLEHALAEEDLIDEDNYAIPTLEERYHGRHLQFFHSALPRLYEAAGL
ncbi:hypothetical protein PM082_006105 [Marasmius tenuissimus]|nr:hypothetical protein PM082_006105 [Marasmius tenuissimus]